MKRLLLLLAMIFGLIRLSQAITFTAPVILDGADTSGGIHNQPSDWTVSQGTWNAKAARYSPATQKLIFDTYRADITAGSVFSMSIEASVYTSTGGLVKIEQYYVAGPGTGNTAVSGTQELYMANRDGSNATCIGCSNVQDNGSTVKIYKVVPSTTSTPNTPVEQNGAFVYANQNKDLAAWYPGGQWIIASVEMSTHALTHNIGNSDVGQFNNLWAISLNGNTWVQLTDFASTWNPAHEDTLAQMPFECYDTANCATGCQYVHSTSAGYGSYACTDTGVAPPAIGFMRSTVGNNLDGANGGAPVVWGERVGLDFRYAFAGIQQLATAEIVMVNGLPALVAYQRNLTPIPSSPAGVGLWNNPGNATAIGTGYEPWTFSSDDKIIGFASDAFAETSAPSPEPISINSQYFTDSVLWTWSNVSPALTDLTAYSNTIYNYQPNNANGFGHWEEPMAFGLGSDISNLVAFASSANLDPTWDPTSGASSANTFGLDIWTIPFDRSSPAVKLTSFNTASVSKKSLAYPTASDPVDNGFFMTVTPTQAQSETNPPGSVYKFSEVSSSTTTQSSSGLSDARAYPNPWRSDRYANIDITFDQLPSGSTVKIFDLSGHWVQSLAASGTSVTWDRRNSHGDTVASGLYIYLITDNQGDKTRGKLTIIK